MEACNCCGAPTSKGVTVPYCAACSTIVGGLVAAIRPAGLLDKLAEPRREPASRGYDLVRRVAGAVGRVASSHSRAEEIAEAVAFINALWSAAESRSSQNELS